MTQRLPSRFSGNVFTTADFIALLPVRVFCGGAGIMDNVSFVVGKVDSDEAVKGVPPPLLRLPADESSFLTSELSTSDPPSSESLTVSVFLRFRNGNLISWFPSRKASQVRFLSTLHSE